MAAHQMGGYAYAIQPSDHDRITHVLRPLVAGQQHLDVGGFVHLADVYSVPPERLAERYAPLPSGTVDDDEDRKSWCFLCPARCRHKAAGAPGDGCWSSDTGDVRIVRGADGRRVGHARALSYGARTTRVTRRGWCMVELSLVDEQAGAGVGGEDLVLCKMFRSPPRTDTTLSPAASTAFFLKRKAVVDQLHPEAPRSVRQHC